MSSKDITRDIERKKKPTQIIQNSFKVNELWVLEIEFGMGATLALYVPGCQLGHCLSIIALKIDLSNGVSWNGIIYKSDKYIDGNTNNELQMRITKTHAYRFCKTFNTIRVFGITDSK